MTGNGSVPYAMGRVAQSARPTTHRPTRLVERSCCLFLPGRVAQGGRGGSQAVTGSLAGPDQHDSHMQAHRASACCQQRSLMRRYQVFCFIVAPHRSPSMATCLTSAVMPVVQVLTREQPAPRPFWQIPLALRGMQHWMISPLTFEWLSDQAATRCRFQRLATPHTAAILRCCRCTDLFPSNCWLQRPRAELVSLSCCFGAVARQLGWKCDRQKL